MLETSQSFSDIAGGHVVGDEVWHFSMINQHLLSKRSHYPYSLFLEHLISIYRDVLYEFSLLFELQPRNAEMVGMKVYQKKRIH